MNNHRSKSSILSSYGALDTPNEPEFDEIVREAATALRTPIALVSLLDEDRQWFKAKVGLTPSETPLSISFVRTLYSRRGFFKFLMRLRTQGLPIVHWSPVNQIFGFMQVFLCVHQAE